MESYIENRNLNEKVVIENIIEENDKVIFISKVYGSIVSGDMETHMDLETYEDNKTDEDFLLNYVINDLGYIRYKEN